MEENKTTKYANGQVTSLCSDCNQELTTINVPVENNDLLLYSCDICDKRSWKLAGKNIDLKEALIEVRDHVYKN